ncbi:MAG: hypothetical protein ACO1SV_12925 [Fimbriimonas sp.]
MVQQILAAFLSSLRTFGVTLSKLAPSLALFVAALAIGLIVLWAADRERFGRLFGRVSGGRSLVGWLAFASFGAVIWLTLPKIGPIVREERTHRLQSSYSTNEDPSVSGVFQYGPLASYVQERTFTRTLTLPPDFLSRIGAEGVQVLSPYLQDPSAENVLKLADTFRRSGENVLFTREVTRLDETPIQIQRAEVKVDLAFRDPGGSVRRSFYDSTFDAVYVFKNPLATPAEARFTFPLPETGTIRDFQLSVNGERVTEPDEEGRYRWAGKLEAGGMATATVKYRTQGGGAWRYEVASGRRQIESFRLSVKANEATRFLRGALYPTRREGDTMIWELPNVITNRQIDLFFAGRGAASDAESKALAFLPFALGSFLAAVGFLAARGRLATEPYALLLGTAGFVVGLFALPIFLQYLSLLWEVPLGAVLGAFLAFRVLGRPVLVPSLFVGLLPLAFVSDTHSGLLTLIAVAAALGYAAGTKK